MLQLEFYVSFGPHERESYEAYLRQVTSVPPTLKPLLLTLSKPLVLPLSKPLVPPPPASAVQVSPPAPTSAVQESPTCRISGIHLPLRRVSNIPVSCCQDIMKGRTCCKSENWRTRARKKVRLISDLPVRAWKALSALINVHSAQRERFDPPKQREDEERLLPKIAAM
ncbi:hypothetical protein EJ05DRAFT_213132 [Pseudovirgaria hyperparasitica]|uniref:Uncharacterized protein n=1 Tax=Pseudovirgaria hyperparasitica TaxID=470096 RepID=A0A6A6VT99_9PEZI|nr:uncharacterized protein EJ05DRAFT_213132 [Pseudovirgaria hyperparasitica]KAF2753375.1 hypothetical protein EJ05DRAFT_213132 [Pseudovirgaria hyperparasitica]